MDCIVQGFDRGNDIKEMKTKIPSIDDTNNTNYLYLANFWKKLDQIDYNTFRYPDINESKGLKELVKLVLGKSLDKTWQFSAWNNRPLRPQQEKYAALDAYCLYEMYEEIKKILQYSKEEFETLVNEFIVSDHRCHMLEQEKAKSKPKKLTKGQKKQAKRDQEQKKMDELGVEDSGGLYEGPYFMG